MKKCKKCGAPLEGFLFKTIGRLMGIKPSEQDQEICNKCSAETAGPKQEVQPIVEAKPEPVKAVSEEKVEAKTAPVEEKKEETNI